MFYVHINNSGNEQRASCSALQKKRELLHRDFLM